MNQSELSEYIGREATISPDTVFRKLEVSSQYIVGELSSGHNVSLPGIGVLTLRSFLSGRRTVSLLNEETLSLPDMKHPLEEDSLKFLSQSIAAVLLKSESVNISDLGQFHPEVRDNGIFASFTPAFALRNKLKTGEASPAPAPEPSPIPRESAEDEADLTESAKAPEDQEENPRPLVKPEEVRSNPPGQSPTPRYHTKRKAIEKTPLQWQLPLWKIKPVYRLYALGLAFLLVILFGLLLLRKSESNLPHSGKETPGSLLILGSSETGSNLLELAEKVYGHEAFWVYIYDFNRKTLPSPMNIESGTRIELPDLSLYGVNVRDTSEIRKALSLAEALLNMNNF